ncbi:hypothetical protein [Streptococcus suis]|uniref:Uncharacterized protein n=1 Tax=Streptococcus suis TaxID=1307 RepID=A0A0Z8H942_STRSU|nr:hypothetical protein [Streptococcus suis]QBX30944.1 hypothetical protein Javan584_0006 [Streptococcus phage Javan584]NQG70250.1 hypothetical protein [Streptococcus suis]NQH64392.1 hypothetical protein [Streptococcus suis]NQI44003.1 hypothetical protein [Streptococcus suis]NQS05892.1 hypothetical protein [Streptococcus suis]
MEKLTKNHLSEIDTIVKMIDIIAESIFLELMMECDNLAEMKSRTSHFDKYSDLPVETAKICEIVAGRVRKTAKEYIDIKNSQHKIVLGE